MKKLKTVENQRDSYSQKSDQRISPDYIGRKFCDSELVIGLVGAVGTRLDKIYEEIDDRLKLYGYNTKKIKISEDIIPKIVDTTKINKTNEYDRISKYMDKGNEARRLSGDNSILALGAAAKIGEGRSESDPFRKRIAYVISSLKHPEEVAMLREIYTEGFFLIGVYSDVSRRKEYLTTEKRIKADLAAELIARDSDENLTHGQRTSYTFYLSDFFIRFDENYYQWKKSIWRILDIIFGDPYKTPTFDEYAMFLAFAASLRSGDMSRQVGAVIAKDREIIATGANDVPKSGGGLYWPIYNEENFEITDEPKGRDFKRGKDSNKEEKDKIIAKIIESLKDLELEESSKIKIIDAVNKSGIKDITEYGRAVHAEMEALLSCARNNNSTKNADLYCTTYPCHNCAKHIIASGIKRVVYVEPYPKSKAEELHDDALILEMSPTVSSHLVHLEPFVGIGPRRFFDLFSMSLGSGYPLIRKQENGEKYEWKTESAKLRIQMLPCSYIERETVATSRFNTLRKEIKDEQQ